MGRILYDVLEINIAVTIVILLLCLLAEKLRKRYGARWLRLAWMLLALRLVIPYNFSLPSTEIRLFNMPGFAQEAQPAIEKTSEEDLIADAGESIAMGQEGTSNPAMNDMAERVEGEDIISPPVEDIGFNVQIEAPENIATDNIENATADNISENTSIDFPGNNVDDNVAAQIPVEKEQTSVNHREGMTYTKVLLHVWLAGVIGFGLYYIIIYVTFQKRCQKGMKPLENGALLEQIDALQTECLGEVKLQVYQSDMASSPMLAGIVRPKLVLPAKGRIWQEQELRMVVLHELCHYRGKDLWLKLFVLAAHCLNWFNPALYLMKKECFYDIELACDMAVLEGCNAEERARYATTMLNFARKEKQNSVFSTGFATGKRKLKNRINNMFENEKKKNGLGAFALMVVLLLGMSLLISCGYKPMELEGENKQQVAGGAFEEADGQNTEEKTAQKNEEQNINNSDDVEQAAFDYNNEYNRILRVYDGMTYLAKGDGIYQVTEAGGICLFENTYDLLRDMEIYRDKLYFCGIVMRGEQLQNTIYYMDLNTLEVRDTLALYSNNFNVLYNIAIYENKLYVFDENAKKIGFELDESGIPVKQLDSEAADYLYKDYNAYVSLQNKRWNTQFDSAEWRELTKIMSDMYVPVMDVAECMELLSGKYVVTKYKDELYQSLYLVNEAREYEYLCDAVNSGEILITTNGLYYANNEGGDFSYVDFENKEQQNIYTMPELGEVYLVNYDANYVYFGKSVWIESGNTKEILMKIPRMGGTPEEVYTFEDGFSINGLCMYSGMDGKYMYFMNHEKILLDDVEASDEGTTGTGPLGMQRVLPEEVAVSPAIAEYTLDEALEIGDVVEFEGNLPGLGIGTWYIVTIDGVEHFWGQYDFEKPEKADYYGYAILSENYELECGIKVGMSQAEVLEKYPYMRIEDFAGNCLSDSDYKEATWWNGAAYPKSVLGIDPDFVYNGKDYNWLDQFDYVMIADIDLGTYDTLPVCLGLLMKDEKVKAITFYYPTAG